MAFQGFSTFLIPTLQYWFVQKGRQKWWLSFILWAVFISPAAALELRVAIREGTNPVKVGSSTEAVVKNANGQQVGTIEGMNAYSAQRGTGGVSVANARANQLWIEPKDNGYVWIGDRWYRGRTLLLSQGNKLVALNYVDLEQYLYSVVGAEAVPSWPIEALKAQAVAARTYALHQRSGATNRLFDVDTTTGTQVYKGLESEYVSTHEAVNATKGEVITHNGKVILAVFHSSSGGHTENVEDVWSNPLPYLRGVADFDQGTPVYEWTKNFSTRELSSLISGVGTVKSMVPERRTPRGRVVTMRVVGDRATRRVSGADLRTALGLRSTLFNVTQNGSNFSVSGRGFGHGVGMSQWGAYNLSMQGYDYRRILSHYYQNTTIAQLNSR